MVWAYHEKQRYYFKQTNFKLNTHWKREMKKTKADMEDRKLSSLGKRDMPGKEWMDLKLWRNKTVTLG